MRVSGWKKGSSLVVSMILGCAIVITSWPPVLAVFLRPVVCCGGMGCTGRFVCFDGLFGLTFFLPALLVGVGGLRGGLLGSGRGCVLHVSVDVLGLLVRKILGWVRLSSVQGPWVLTGQLRGDSLDDGSVGVGGCSASH